MLPDIRQSDYLYPVPKFDLNQDDVDDFTNELKGFHEQFEDCFLRSESRDNFDKRPGSCQCIENMLGSAGSDPHPGRNSVYAP